MVFWHYTRFSGSLSSLDITNGNRSHNKPLETNLNNLKALLIITTVAKDISKYDTSNFEENKVN